MDWTPIFKNVLAMFGTALVLWVMVIFIDELWKAYRGGKK